MLAMLVDDSQSSLSHMKRVLEGCGDIEGQTFADAGLALEAAGRLRFDLVIVDHVMPKMDGITFIRLLRDRPSYAQVPVVMLTGSSSQGVKLEALEAGATDFLPKTSNGIELGAKLRNLIALSRAVRERDNHADWLAREIEVATRKLHEREEEMIFRLSLAVEYRDNDTGEHTLRVARYSRMIAEELGLPPDRCRSIYLAAPLHDVGKVAVPDQVLLKAGRLTEEETIIVRTHAAVGERILGDSGSDLMRLAAEIAGHHHERWDGKGYPKGIAGTAIPLSARIVAVADVFDAMTTARPYKGAMPVEAAMEVLLAERDRHFDPRCIDAFVAAYARLPPPTTGAKALAAPAEPTAPGPVPIGDPIRSETAATPSCSHPSAPLPHPEATPPPGRPRTRSTAMSLPPPTDTLQGNCLLIDADAVHARLRDLTASGKPVSLDLSRMGAVDISFVQLMVSASRTAERNKQSLTLTGITPALRSVFERAGVGIDPIAGRITQH